MSIIEHNSNSGNKNSTEFFYSGLKSKERANSIDVISYFDSVLQVHVNNNIAQINQGNVIAR